MRYHVVSEQDLHQLASLFPCMNLNKPALADFLSAVRLVADTDEVVAVREYDTDSFSIELVSGTILLIYPFQIWEQPLNF